MSVISIRDLKFVPPYILQIAFIFIFPFFLKALPLPCMVTTLMIVIKISVCKSYYATYFMNCSQGLFQYFLWFQKVKYFLQARWKGGQAGADAPSCLSVGGAGGAKVPFLNAVICFLIVNMIQRRSYELKASNV